MCLSFIFDNKSVSIFSLDHLVTTLTPNSNLTLVMNTHTHTKVRCPGIWNHQSIFLLSYLPVWQCPGWRCFILKAWYKDWLDTRPQAKGRASVYWPWRENDCRNVPSLMLVKQGENGSMGQAGGSDGRPVPHVPMGQVPWVNTELFPYPEQWSSPISSERIPEYCRSPSGQT